MIDHKLFQYENDLYEQGYQYIAGVDEAGRGPLAGPVVAAAVILKKDCVLQYVNDSKKLTKKLRLLALEEIKEAALAIGVSFVSVEDIDRINIYRATKLAMQAAIDALKIKPEYVLIDAMPLELAYPLKSIIKGDSLSASIAAASIVAKTTRDAYMEEMSKQYPEYGFDQHMGYGTKKHIEAIHQYGITNLHRKSYEPVKSFIIQNKKR